MKQAEIIQRSKKEAYYIIENKATVRQTAEYFRTSKSTVHKDIQQRLRTFDQHLADEAQAVLAHNLSVRHIRGGVSTKKHWESKNLEEN